VPRRICILLFTFTIVVAAALPAVAQLLPQVTPKPAKAPATKPAQIVVDTSPNAEARQLLELSCSVREFFKCSRFAVKLGWVVVI